MNRYTKSTTQTLRVDVAGMHARIELTWTETDEYLAHRTLDSLRTAITGPAAEAYQHVGPWDIETVTRERSTTTPFTEPILIELAGRNFDPEEGA